MDISRNDFIRLTTQGYPIYLGHPLEEFYTMFAEFVNQTKENNFYAELDEGVILHAGMRTEVCKVVYRKGKVFILSKISSDNQHPVSDEFSLEESLQILGHACLGVLYFCDLYANATNQAPVEKDKKHVDNNIKYDIWPM